MIAPEYISELYIPVITPPYAVTACLVLSCGMTPLFHRLTPHYMIGATLDQCNESICCSVPHVIDCTAFSQTLPFP